MIGSTLYGALWPVRLYALLCVLPVLPVLPALCTVWAGATTPCATRPPTLLTPAAGSTPLASVGVGNREYLTRRQGHGYNGHMTTTQIPAEIAEQAAGRPVRRINDDTFQTTGPCNRCGGQGGWKGWPGFTCFRCAGTGTDPTPVRLYTAAKRAKLDAANAKRQAAKDAKVAQQMAAAESTNVALLPELPVIWAAIDNDYDAETCSHRTISGFIQSVAGKAHHFPMSERQVESLRSAWIKHLEFLARKDAEKAAEQPVPTGKAITVEGEVVTTKLVEGNYGSQLKMLVKGQGWKVWSTVPAGLVPVGGLQGHTVRFVADVDASDDDKAFGFARRPRKAEVVG